MSPKRLRPHSNSDSTGLRPSSSTAQSGDGNISIIDISDDEDIEEVYVANLDEDVNIQISDGSGPSGVPAVHFLNLSDSPITIRPSSTSVNPVPTGANRYVSTPPLFIPPSPPSSRRGEANRFATTPLYIPPSPPRGGTNRYINTPPLYIPPTPYRRGGANRFVATPPPPHPNIPSPPGASDTPHPNIPSPPGASDTPPRYAVTPPLNMLNETVDLTDSPLAAAASPEEDPPGSASPQEDSPFGSPETSPFSCPVCLDNLPRIKSSGRNMMSTVCGHVFCSSCLSACFKSNGRCPTCRKMLLSKDMHQIFI